MRVLHAAKHYPPANGGMETVVRDLCDGTADEWDVKVVAAHTERQSISERIGRVHVLRAGSLGKASSVPLCPTLPWHLWRSKADCVVLHEPNPVAGTALYLHTPADRLVIWHHSDLLRPWWAPHTYGHVQRALYRRAAAVIVSSPNLADESPLVRQARRVEVIPFGIPTERFRRTDAARTATVDKIRAYVAGPRVLFVGRLVYYKGIDVLVRAMARCNGTLLLVGEGPLEPDLRRQVNALGLEDRVKFLGSVSEDMLPAYYQASDVFVLPSVARTEAFGIVQVEAMAAGLPVVSTNLPTGVPWVNQDGQTGIVVPPADDAALGLALARLLSDPDLRARLGRNAAARAEAAFDRQTMVDRFKAVVDSSVAAAVTERAREASAGVV